MTNFPASGGNMHDALCASFNQAVARMAALKNLELNPEQCATVTEGMAMPEFPIALHPGDQVKDIAALLLPPHGRQQLPEDLAILNDYLDAVAVGRLVTMTAEIERKDRLDPAVTALVSSIVQTARAGSAATYCFRWPDLHALLRQCYATIPRGPHVAMSEDGAIMTSYWLGSKPHRDPSLGPASIEEKGARRIEQYLVEGKLHRPHQDGPASILTEVLADGTRRLEAAWWSMDQRHRPHQEGPARTGAAGRSRRALSSASPLPLKVARMMEAVDGEVVIWEPRLHTALYGRSSTPTHHAVPTAAWPRAGLFKIAWSAA